MKRILCLALVLLLPVAASAKTLLSPTHVKLPPPDALVGPNSISIAVVRARPDDAGFRSLLNTAWNRLSQRRGAERNPLWKLLLDFFDSNGKANALESFLPLQAVRVDSLDSKAHPTPTIAVTVAGWAGIQTLFYQGLKHSSKGTYPTRDYHGETLVLRKGWKDPTRAAILSRVNGTFLEFPTLTRAHAVIDRLHEDSTSLPDTPLAKLLPGLNHAQDTYGAILNRDDALLKFLYWLNKKDVSRVYQCVGQDRLKVILSGVRSMTWQGDLISDNQINFLIHFQTNGQKSSQQLAQGLGQVKKVLGRYGRVGQMKIDPSHDQVTVNFNMIGYRRAVQAYIDRGL